MATLSNNALKDIRATLGAANVFEDEPMKAHSNMEVGGPARYMFTPGSGAEIAYLIDILKTEDIPYYVIGKGSNVIFRDEGYDGAVIKILDRFKGISIDDERANIKAGELNSDIAAALADASLSGFEFASGIPGCIGGGVAMNAGAYDGEMKDVVEDVTVLTKEGSVEKISNHEMAFGYRKSAVMEKGYIVLETTLRLKKGNREDILANIDELTKKRESRQPLEYPSCGSVFKRPEGYFAGGLITEAGLKGKSIGGAQVSDKHAGFIINKGNATAKDVTDLIELIQKTVYEKSGVMLKCEVKIL